MSAKSTRCKMTLVRQTCELIPSQLVPKLAREYEIDARGFSAWSHTIAHIYGQLTHAVGLNDICDGLALNSSGLRTIRGATPPKRNTFSNANRTRDPRMAEALYWRMIDYLPTVAPSFGARRIRSGYLRRFRTAIHAVDSTTIQLVANCMDWAKHRRRKAAAKCHMNLDLHTMLPCCAVVDTAKFHDSKKAWEVCSTLQDGEIVVFDKAYLDFVHLNELDERGVSWVSRAKDSMQYRTVKKLNTTSHPSVLRDQIIELTGVRTKQNYPKRLRLIEAIDEVDGKNVAMMFVTNNLEWSAWTVAELYRARWDIEVFFKEIKQTVQLVDFVGHNKKAVLWQIWTALLAHLLVRFLAHLSRWGTASHVCLRFCALDSGTGLTSLISCAAMGQPEAHSECSHAHNTRICPALEPLQIFLWDSQNAEGPHRGSAMRKSCKARSESQWKMLRNGQRCSHVRRLMG